MLPDSLPLAGKIILLAPGVSGPYLAGPFANGVSDAGAPIQEGRVTDQQVPSFSERPMIIGGSRARLTAHDEFMVQDDGRWTTPITPTGRLALRRSSIRRLPVR